VVLLGVPVGAMEKVLTELKPHLAPSTILTDVGSTKSQIVELAKTVLPEGVHFVGGHPIAGSQHAGVEAADPLLFKDRIYVLCPQPDTPPEVLLTLMNLVDDATGISLGLFNQEETIVAAATLLSIWISKYGIPGSLYVDLRNMYGRLPTEKELMEQKHPFSQFGRMCDKLGIEIIFAHSPQAKGRVERLNGVHQDRLIKKMRLKGIKDRENANQYLLEEYFQEHNNRFAIAPANKEDFHVPKPAEINLDEIFCFSHPRTVSKDWIVRYENRLFQIKPRSNYGPAVAKAAVQVHLNGRITILYRNEKAMFEELDPQSPIVKALAWARNNRKILRQYRPSTAR